MKEYLITIKNPDITEYVEAMTSWIRDNSQSSPEVISELFTRNHEQIDNLFKPYPETIFHDDPAKWAELLATNWGLIQEQELEFA